MSGRCVIEIVVLACTSGRLILITHVSYGAENALERPPKPGEITGEALWIASSIPAMTYSRLSRKDHWVSPALFQFLKIFVIHISELGDHTVKQPQEGVKLGQEVEAKIIEVDIKARRIVLPCLSSQTRGIA